MEKRTTKKPTENKPKTWADLTGKMTLFGNYHEGKESGFYTYSVSIGRKQDDGTYKNAYIDVMFSKGKDPECDEMFDITVKKAFFTVHSYKTKDGKEVNVPAIMVTDYD